jgi:hypothetical protein
MFGSSRPFCAGVIRFLLLALLAFGLLAGTTFFIATLIASLQHGSWDQPFSLITGLSCGLIVWLFVAIFHVRHETQRISISQREPFLGEATAILIKMGYAPSSPEPNLLLFRPRFHALLFGGGIQLTIEGHYAHLSGPKMSLEIFRQRYRLQHHVNRVQQVLQDQRKVTDNVLKRVELRLRLQPEQMEAVRDNVIALLRESGEVICEINLLCHSEQGIREDVVEFQIRGWLEQQGISCAIHKDLVQFVEVVHTTPDAETVLP